MRSLTWFARLGLVVAAGALLVTAVVVAVAPRVWQIANAHEELPVDLPDFQPLAQRSYAYDIQGNEIAVFEAENSQPVSLAQVPPHVITAFLAVEDKEFYSHDGVNIRSLVRATLSNFSSDVRPAGRLDDHHAGRQERLPRRARAGRSLQAAAGPLRADARSRARRRTRSSSAT